MSALLDDVVRRSAAMELLHVFIAFQAVTKKSRNGIAQTNEFISLIGEAAHEHLPVSDLIRNGADTAMMAVLSKPMAGWAWSQEKTA